jgi:uncharacterized protein
VVLIIDGHNLIPKIPGLSLSMMDDEIKLIHLLQDYARIKRQSLDVYFDQAPPGFAGIRRFGMVSAHFVRQGRTADDEIVAHLARMKKAARNVTVVTSDRRIRAEAQAMRVEVLSSEDFAGRLIAALAADSGGGGQETKNDGGADLDEWLHLFGAEDER